MITMSAAVKLKAIRSPIMVCSMLGISGNRKTEVAERDTKMAVPSEAPTWFKVLERALAC